MINFINYSIVLVRMAGYGCRNRNGLMLCRYVVRNDDFFVKFRKFPVVKTARGIGLKELCEARVLVHSGDLLDFEGCSLIFGEGYDVGRTYLEFDVDDKKKVEHFSLDLEDASDLLNSYCLLRVYGVRNRSKGVVNIGVLNLGIGSLERHNVPLDNMLFNARVSPMSFLN